MPSEAKDLISERSTESAMLEIQDRVEAPTAASEEAADVVVLAPGEIDAATLSLKALAAAIPKAAPLAAAKAPDEKEKMSVSVLPLPGAKPPHTDISFFGSSRSLSCAVFAEGVAVDDVAIVGFSLGGR